IQTLTLPHLTLLANQLQLTSFVTLLDSDQVITVTSVEPAHGHASIAQRPGTRHHISQGAPGHTIEATLSDREHAQIFGPNAPLTPGGLKAREQGYAISSDEVIRGLTSVAVPLRLP